jgi:hypothetical protein
MSATITEQQFAQAKPEFIRFPRAGARCPHTGLSRAFLYELTNSGKVRSVSIRSRGKARGVRLIDYDSLMAFIRSQADESKEAA